MNVLNFIAQGKIVSFAIPDHVPRIGEHVLLMENIAVPGVMPRKMEYEVKMVTYDYQQSAVLVHLELLA